MADIEQGLQKANRVLDLILPFMGQLGLGISGAFALYNTFRREAPKPDAYPELSELEFAQLLKKKAEQLVADVRADREAVLSDPDPLQ